MKTLQQFIFESLRVKEDSPLMSRAIKNMKPDKEIDNEFSSHTKKIIKQADTDDDDEYDRSQHAAISAHYNDPRHGASAVEKATTHEISKPMTLFRGVSDNHPLNQELSKSKPGDKIAVSGGTSHRRKTPKKFGKTGSVLVVHAKPGTKAAHVSGIMRQHEQEEGLESEHEVLLGHHKAKYLGSEVINGVTHHHIETGDN